MNEKTETRITVTVTAIEDLEDALRLTERGDRTVFEAIAPHDLNTDGLGLDIITLARGRYAVQYYDYSRENADEIHDLDGVLESARGTLEAAATYAELEEARKEA